MSKHTPAPWEYQVIKNKIKVKIKENLSLTIANIYDDDCNVPTCCKTEEHANAKLIAAAPELLEALEFLLKAAIHCDPFFETRWSIAADKAKAAIKKATE